MRITYLELNNFANIYTAINKKKLKIDLSKYSNRIILIQGRNGSGKTSILSELHPYAYSGNMDVRNNTSLILPKEDGYKEIHIEDDNNIYIIKHYYKYQVKKGIDTISLKSFISKNGEELNPNGNVSSFKEMVLYELHLEPDFLKLIRLGSNVTNMIGMTPAERKSFMSLMLSDVDEYMKKHKIISEGVRDLNNNMKGITSKIQSLKVHNIDDLKNDIEVLSKEKEELNKELSEVQISYGVTEGKLNSLKEKQKEYDIYDFEDELRSLRNRIYDCEEDLKGFPKDLISIKVEDLVFVKTKSEDTLNEVNNKISILNEKKNMLYNNKTDIDIRISKFKIDKDYGITISAYNDMKDQYKKLEEIYKVKSKPDLSKDKFLMIVDILNEIDDIIYNIYGFDKYAVREVVNMIRKKKDIPALCRKKYISLENKSIDTVNDVVILFRPPECIVNNCPYMYLHDLITAKEDKDTDKWNSRDYIENIENINKNIEYVLMIIKSNIKLISEANLDDFNIDNILNKIYQYESIINNNKLNLLANEIEEYESFIKLKSNINELEPVIASMDTNENLIKELRDQQAKIDSDILEVEEMLIDGNEYKSEIEATIQETDNIISFKEALNEKESKLIVYKEREKKYLDLYDEFKSLRLERHGTEKMLDSIKSSIKNRDDLILEYNIKMKQFESLQSEMIDLKIKYDEMILVRESLSSTKGIPLLYMEAYLKNIAISINELLEIVYPNGDFLVNDFIINSTEFRIPYTKNGIEIDDIGFASQGEQSFISLALSFALITQSIGKYNIPLFDELDGALDTKNRGLFLNMLEKQMDIINAEQVFVISHNDVFDGYPTDKILTNEL